MSGTFACAAPRSHQYNSKIERECDSVCSEQLYGIMNVPISCINICISNEMSNNNDEYQKQVTMMYGVLYTVHTTHMHPMV